MDRLYRNVKTGELKRLPPKVYQAVNRHWVEAEESIIQEEDPYIDFRLSSTGDPSKESLQATYEAISGQKPDGRWSEKKLIQKIEELKDNK